MFFHVRKEGKHMTNTDLLKDWIAKSGLKTSYIAEQMGISRSVLWKKVNNLSAFNQYEIDDLCRILNIQSLSDKESIFFAQNVD